MSQSPPPAPVRAVLLDSLGTLLELRDPVGPLRAELRERLGVEVSTARARTALMQEIAFYRANHVDARDRASLATLRRRCARVLVQALGEPGYGIDTGEAVEALLAALRFRPYREAAATLERLRRRGIRLVVVSNWDVSLHDVLRETGLDVHLTGTITSAEIGSPKPSRAIFDHALTIAGVPARYAIHVGDSLREDVAGARAAGIFPVLVACGDGPVPRDLTVISSLRELPALLD
jgi:putative hydrolase of the HAD superfamily